MLWYLLSTLHSRLASEQAQLKEELEAVRQDNIQLVREHNHVKQACEELRRLHDDDQREVADMRMLHQQVPVELANPSTPLHAYTASDEITYIFTNRCILSAHTVAHSFPSSTALQFNHLDLDI